MSQAQVYNTPEPSNPLLDQLMVEMGLGFNAYLERRAALAHLQRLEELSDVELAGMGLRRDMILDYVVRYIGSGSQPN